MAEVTAQMVKRLRDATGMAMHKCKDALEKSGADHEKAIEYLRKNGMSAGAKKSDREAKEGLIAFAEDAKALTLLEANVETDFVANNERFKAFVDDVLKQAQASKPATLADLLAQAYQKDPSITVEQKRNLAVAELGENIQLRRLEVIQKAANCSYGVYRHGAKLLVIVEIEGDTEQTAIAKNVAMHVAAANPEFVSPAEIPAEYIAKETEIAREQMKDKPANMIDKIVAGKIKAREAEICLVCQKFIMNPDETVQQYVENAGKQTGKTLSVRRFWALKVGQA